MMNLFKYFEISFWVYILAFISVFTATFTPFIIISILIITHELGHFLTAKILGIKTDKIYIYPLGGISKFSLPLNSSSIKELLILISGPLFQQISYYVLLIITPKNTHLIHLYHYGILLFNLLPIYPLDGGKILHLFLSEFIPYKKSLKISILISYIIIMFLFFININNLKLNTIVIIFFLTYKATKEYTKINLIYEKFILERYLNNYPFKKVKIVKNINNFFKNKKHLIKENEEYYLENEFLSKKYKKTVDLKNII